MLFILCLLIASAVPSQGQIVHENPDNLEPGSSYDADQKLMLALQEMFGSIETIATYLNASDYNASRDAMRAFEGSYDRFLDVFKRSGPSDQNLQALGLQMDLFREDLQTIIDDSEIYMTDYDEFHDFMSSGDTGEATAIATRMQAYYTNVSSTGRGLAANATAALKLLEGTSVDTGRAEYGLNVLDEYLDQLAETNIVPSSMARNISLTLGASDTSAVSGDTLLLTAKLALDGSPLAGRIVDYYVDSQWIDSATTDSAGYAYLAYTVDSRSFNSQIRLSSKFDSKEDASLPPAVSNVVLITRPDEAARLSLDVTPGTLSYGDIFHIRGSLETATGIVVPGRTVELYLGDRHVGTAITFNDGSFASDIPLDQGMPSGRVAMTARYSQLPGDVLMDTASNAVSLTVLQDGTRLTMGSPVGSYSGGEAATFQGTLYTNGGSPVSGATIGVYADNALIGRGTTDGQGYYGFTTAVPYGLSAGSHMVYAAYAPGDAEVLTGSRSEEYSADFLRSMPTITVNGMPLILFSGDTLNISGAVMTHSEPMGSRTLLVNMSGVTVGEADIDADGGYQFSHNITYGPGIYTLTISSPEDGLLETTELNAGTIFIMPFDAITSTIVAAAAVVLIAIGALYASRNSRIWRRKTAEKKQLPGPRVTPMPEYQPENVPAPAVSSFETEIEQINSFIEKGGDRSDVISNIYLAARRLADSHGTHVAGSATHREFFEAMTASQPSLHTPLSLITNNYEIAVFGHEQLSDQDIINSIYRLKEYDASLTGGKST